MEQMYVFYLEKQKDVTNCRFLSFQLLLDDGLLETNA